MECGSMQLFYCFEDHEISQARKSKEVKSGNEVDLKKNEAVKRISQQW